MTKLNFGFIWGRYANPNLKTNKKLKKLKVFMKKAFSSVFFYRLFIFITLTALAITVLVPISWVALSSLKSNAEFYGDPWRLPARLNFKNFTEAWNEANMGAYFANSASVTVLAIFILLACAIPAAYVLSRFSFKGRGIIRTVFMSGIFINTSYLVIPIFLMLVGANSLLATGFFLNNRTVLAIVYAATALPFTIYLLQGYFQSLPKEYEEAAFVDGAGYFRTMTTIIVPMARPAVITVILFNFLAFWNEYIIAITLMTNDSAKTLPVGLMNLMKAQNAAAEYGRMYAGLVIVMLPTLIFYIFVQKKLTEGLSLGGIKG